MKAIGLLTGLVLLAGLIAAAAAGAAAPGGKGTLEINVTDVLGNNLPAKVELHGAGKAKPVVIEAPKGALETQAPPGKYKAYTYVYFLEVPVLVEVEDVEVKAGGTAFVIVNLLEGIGGDRPLLDFDRDCDFALDRVEVKCGTNPNDAGSIPGRDPLPFDDRVLGKEERWYRGELHAHSVHGGGKESVSELVSRAEKAGLDFLAITDRNTVEACADPKFKSNSVVLIPALEWGTDEKGVALIYGPRTFPELTDSRPQAQALVDLTQAQGGFFAIAHPCFPTAPWQLGLAYVNGVEVWCRDWNAVPPLSLEHLDEDLKERVEGKLVHSIAFAAGSDQTQYGGLSANGQASVFYDSELVRGLRAAVIGGSNTSSPDVPMGSPVTYVYAREKSVKGILDGLRRGRTYVSKGLKGPKIKFVADVLKDNKVDVSLGGIIPLGVPTTFEVVVEDAEGKQLQVLLNGEPLITKTIEGRSFALRFEDTPKNYAVYRVRVTGKALEGGFGAVEVLAMTSPIYAQDLKIPNPELKAYQKEHPASKALPSSAGQIRLPENPNAPGAREIKPKWRF